ncbi:MAG: FGGY-family carbohydrate kinase [Gammaproteobacteria bacterium]|nr:FGGY-family carbohydrate kinase [Gammaproteobacteria bacterium]
MATVAYLGIDIGTSGIRGCCIDADKNELCSHRIAFTNHRVVKGRNEQDPNRWLTQLDGLITALSQQCLQLEEPHQIGAIAIDGTSSTLIACKKDGYALSPALMYNDQQSQQQAEKISRFAPAKSAVHGASSSLAKALFLLEKFPETEIFCHQADWLAASLTGLYGISDENNCLKLGYDSITQCWPTWLQENSENVIINKNLLPHVIAPGTIIANVKAELIDKYQLANDCAVIAGTTDSNAAVLASGASQIGDAVTSLGSTLVLKVFSDKALFEPAYGIYSHRLKGQWLVGGASNSGGSVLLQHFSQTQLDNMTMQLKPEQPTGLNYYPLPGIGERFPVNDSHKKNMTDPRPPSAVTFFQALLEGIANIEAEGYKKLEALGCTAPTKIFTAGGGNKNIPWTKIREQATGTTILNAVHSEACFGSALLARDGCLNTTH